MAYAIPTSGMLTICLVLSGCDPATRIDTVIERVESYQHAQQCTFGVSETDFRMALLWLAVLHGKMDGFGLAQAESVLGSIALGDWIVPMLHYEGVYFNDEGEAWDEGNEAGDYGRQLRQFFAQPANLNRRRLRPSLPSTASTLKRYCAGRVTRRISSRAVYRNPRPLTQNNQVTKGTKVLIRVHLCVLRAFVSPCELFFGL